MSYVPNVPVPPVNSSSNQFQSEVVGNKNDDEDGSSLAAKSFRIDRHDHSAAMCYPTGAPGVDVTKSATPWTLGAFAVVVPAGTIAEHFDIHGINYDDTASNAGTYELVLYAGPDGSEVEIGRVRFARVGTTQQPFESPFMCPIQAPNTQIKAKVMGSNGSASVITISLRYHLY